MWSNVGRKYIVALGGPLLIAGVGALVLWAVNDRLPEQVATHWGPGGQADDFTARQDIPGLVFLLTAAVGLVIGTLMLAIGRRAAFAARPMLSLPAGIAGFMAALMVFGSLRQIGTDGPAELGWEMAAAVATGLALGAGAFRLLGPDEPLPSTPEAAPAGNERLPLSDREVAAWTGTTPISRSLVLVALIPTVIMVVSAALSSWWMLALLVPLLLLLGANTWFRVVVGPAGVAATSVLGWPKVTVPLGEITDAVAGQARALEYGGWGMRIRTNGDGAILTRSGDALVISRTNERTVAITLDDPATPASLLATLMDRRTAQGPA